MSLSSIKNGEMSVGNQTDAALSVGAMAPVDFLIVTALPEERDAVLMQLATSVQLEKSSGDVHTFYFAQVPTGRHNSDYRVIVTCLLQMGPLHAAAYTAAAVVRWRPQAVLMVGIAGGVRGQAELGDVLLADKVADYTVGKIETLEDGTPNRVTRWESYPVDALLFDDAHNLRVPWRSSITVTRPTDGLPAVRTGTIASGGDVVAHAETVDKLRNTWPKLVGIEMEGGGVATSLHATFDRPRFLMIRAVSDHADKKKSKRATTAWRPHACDVAAAYVLAFLRSSSLVPVSVPNASARGMSVPALATGEATPSNQASARRNRDVATLKELWATFPTDEIDHFLDRAQYGIIPGSTLFYWEGFAGYVRSSVFQLHDEKLRDAVEKFAGAFMEVFSFQDYFDTTPGSEEAKFVPQYCRPGQGHRRDARTRFDSSLTKLRAAYAELLALTKTAWVEIDLRETNQAAHEARRAFDLKTAELLADLGPEIIQPPSEPSVPVEAGTKLSLKSTTDDDSGLAGKNDAFAVTVKYGGVLMSNRADISPRRVRYRFKGKWLASNRNEDPRCVTFHALYQRPDGLFLVYEEVNYHGDYVTATLHGRDRPLTANDLLDGPFVHVASQAGIVRDVEIP